LENFDCKKALKSVILLIRRQYKKAKEADNDIRKILESYCKT